MRYFIKSLAPHFRLVFNDGPRSSEMHEDLKRVYSHMGPCRRWSCWLPHHPPLDHALATKELERCLTNAMDEDEGTGEWVGLLGFNQGAKVAFSILLKNQLRLENDPWAPGFAGVHWQFGVIMAGRGPPFSPDRIKRRNQHYSSLTQLSQDCENALIYRPFPDILQTPTLHVRGLQDAGLHMHRALLKRCTSPPTARFIVWDGAHRIPIKSADVTKITEAILEVAKVS